MMVNRGEALERASQKSRLYRENVKGDKKEQNLLSYADGGLTPTPPPLIADKSPKKSSFFNALHYLHTLYR